MIIYATENGFRVFFCIMLIKLFLVSYCARISITLIKVNKLKEPQGYAVLFLFDAFGIRRC